MDGTRWAPSRRALLTGALASAALGACTNGRRGGSPTAAGKPATDASEAAASGGSLAAPTVLDSAGGLLDVELVVGAGPVPHGAGTRWAMTYNGTVPGPTLRVRPGDRLRVHLVNRLDEPTNLHTHGLAVSPTGAADDPFVMVGPGEVHQYEYEIPADHRSGLFWYHPHHHGRVAAQVGAGLAGAIVVVDAIDDGPLSDTVERTMVLGDPRLGGDPASVLAVSGMEQMQGRRGDGIVVNGGREPTITATTGTVERWRLVNATPSRRLRLAIDGAAWWLAATDGGRLPRPVATPEVLLVPGERVELLVPLRAAGAMTVTATTEAPGMGGMMGGGGTSTQTLLRATVTGEDATPPVVDSPLADVAPVADRAIARRRTIALAMGMGGGGGGMGGMGGGGGGMSPTIDGRSFDASRTDIRAVLGTTEEWTITASAQMAHPFHLHVWPFQVVARSDGRPQPGWKDVVDVPAGGWVRVRVPFEQLTGRTVYHCHILDHEDLGMMGVIEVA